VGVHPIAVNDCIGQSFPKRQFNAALISGNAARLSISRISRSVSGEMALISLGILASISSKE
jgi:hypothetical protein